MLFKQTVSSRILELCKNHNYTPNKLAELSTIPPTTLNSMLSNKVDNPSSTNIYKICKIFNITLKEFFDSDFFNFENIID